MSGHLRTAIAVERREATIPVSYVELADDEEPQVLATFDPIGAMAGSDSSSLEALHTHITSADVAVQALLAKIARDTQADNQSAS